MITQKFKGDALELKMEEVGIPAMDLCGQALDDYNAGGYDSAPFLLMLYDEGKMPFSDRVPRDSFVAFFREALTRFPFTGTFESYIFIMQSIFGDGSTVLFDVPAPGKIQMLVNAASSLEFNFVAKEFIDGIVQENNVVDSDGNQFTFRGIFGIDSEFELQMLLAELIPAGIFPDITLAFFSIYSFVDDEDNSIVTDLGDSIIFLET